MTIFKLEGEAIESEGSHRKAESVPFIIHQSMGGLHSVGQGAVFKPLIGHDLRSVLCDQDERIVGKENGVAVDGMKRQIARARNRRNNVKAKVCIYRYPEGRFVVFHDLQLTGYNAKAKLWMPVKKTKACE